MNQALIERKKKYFYLVVIFLSSVAIRIGLSTLTPLPTIFYDELSYNKIARSLYYNLNTDFRSQLFIFKNILYPIIIAPSFILKDPQKIYMTIKIIGSIIMSTVVFGVFSISNEVENNKSVTILISLLSVLIPDMFYTTKIMSEVLYYPLVILCFLLILRDIKSNKTDYRNLIYLVITFFLVYLCKAVGIALFLSYILFLMIDYLLFRKSNLKQLINKLFLVILGFSFLYLTYGYIFNKLNDVYAYKDFYSGLFRNIINFQFIVNYIYALLIYIFYTIIAFFIFPVIIPICNINKLEDNNKRFTIYTCLALLVSICSIIYLITMKEDAGRIDPRIHLRYIFPFFIIFIAIFVHAIKEKVILNKVNISVFLFLILSIILINISLRTSTSTDSPMLYYIYIISSKFVILGTFIKIFTCIFIIYIWLNLTIMYNRNNVNLTVKFILLFIIISLISNVLIYSGNIKGYKADNLLKEEVVKINNYFNYNHGNITLMPENIYDNNIWELESFLDKDYKFASLKDSMNYIMNDGSVDLSKVKVDAYISGSFNKNSLKNTDYIITNSNCDSIFENVNKINIDGVNDYYIYKVNKPDLKIKYIPNNIYSDHWIGENASIQIYNINKEIELNLLVDNGDTNDDITMVFTDGTGKITKMKAPQKPTWIKVLVSKDISKNYFELKLNSEGFFIPNELDKNSMDKRKLSYRIINIK